MAKKRPRGTSAEPPPTSKRRAFPSRISTKDALFKLAAEMEGFVYPDLKTPQPSNFESLLMRMQKRRESVRGGEFSKIDARELVAKMRREVSEENIKDKYLPILMGDKGSKISYSRGNLFSRLDFLSERLAKPEPDQYDGIEPDSLAKSVPGELRDSIIPCADPEALCLPNFFLEVEAPGGMYWVAENQVINGGVAGARAVREMKRYIHEQRRK